MAKKKKFNSPEDYEQGIWNPLILNWPGARKRQRATGTYTVIGNVAYLSATVRLKKKR